jgi:P-type E1-E2 ATPase
MLEIAVPGFGELKLEHVLFDFNGTLAVDGKLIAGLAPLLNELSKTLKIHVVTGDSSGTARQELAGIDCQIMIVGAENQGIAKVKYLKQLGSQAAVAIGNGRNDHYLLKAVDVGIAIVGEEGASSETLMAADVVVPSIFSAIGLLQHPRRLIATLRS